MSRGTRAGAASFYPGDMGPYGIVQAPGLGLKFVGTTWFPIDATTFVTTKFAYSGTVTDICAALA